MTKNGETRWTVRPTVVLGATILWLAMAFFYAYMASWRPPLPASTPEEDAFISFRYAEHMANGLGPVFNPGQDPVEGYTNFLWVAWLALIHGSFPDTVANSLLGGLAAGFLGLVLAWLLARQVWPRWAWTVPLAMACSQAYTGNSLTGMETMAYTTLLLASLTAVGVALTRPQGAGRTLASISASILMALVAMTRFDGLIVFAVGSAFWEWHGRRTGRRSTVDPAWYVPFAVIYGIYTVWRLWIFGAVLPNTYWAKLAITGTGWPKLVAGLNHVGQFALGHPALTLLAGAGLVAAIKSTVAPAVRLTAAMMAAHVVVVAWVGGDWSYLNHYWRLLMPVVPMAFVIGLAATRKLVDTHGGRAAVGLVACCLILALVSPSVSLESNKKTRTPPQPTLVRKIVRTPHELGPRLASLAAPIDRHPERRFGLWLAEQLGPAAIIAGDHAGRVPYYSQLAFVDFFGYTDREIIRRRSRSRDVESELGRWESIWNEVLSRNPTAVLVPAKPDAPEMLEAFSTTAGPAGYQAQAAVALSKGPPSLLVFTIQGAGDGETSWSFDPSGGWFRAESVPTIRFDETN